MAWTRCSTGSFAILVAIFSPTPGSAMIGNWMLVRIGIRSGSAGDTSVTERIRSGWRAASCTLMAPPMELPNRCTGSAKRASISSASTSACALGL